MSIFKWLFGSVFAIKVIDQGDHKLATVDVMLSHQQFRTIPIWPELLEQAVLMGYFVPYGQDHQLISQEGRIIRGIVDGELVSYYILELEISFSSVLAGDLQSEPVPSTIELKR